MNLYQYSFNNPVNYSDFDGNLPKWVSKVLKITAIVTVTALTIATVVAAAPAIIETTSVYLGALGIGSSLMAPVVNTAVTVVSSALAINAVNRSAEVITGKNMIADKLMYGNYDLYDNIEQGLFITSSAAGMYSQTYGHYPSTGRNQPNNIKEQICLNEAMKNPQNNSVIIPYLNDTRMSGFFGWQKSSYSFPDSGLQIHSVSNKYIPIYFDFKIKTK